MLANWPTRADVTSWPEPSNLEVTQWLAAAKKNAPSHTVALVRALSKMSANLRWQQTYSTDDMPPAFLARYGWSLLVGPTAPTRSPSVLAGVLLLGPDVEYPLHKHAAEESYLVLSGAASWRVGTAGWEVKTAGQIVHNPPWQPHAMRTDQNEPLLVGFVWRAGAAHKSLIIADGA